MDRLIWKELREQWIWAAIFFMASLGTTLAGTGYVMVGSTGQFSGWVWLPMAAALLFGAGALTSETSGGTAAFLYSKPVSWKKILAAKLLVGVSVLVVSAVVCAVAFKATAPSQYESFMTLPYLINGILTALLYTGVPYLLGVIGSALIPGRAGGATSTLIVMALVALSMFLRYRNSGPSSAVNSILAGWALGFAVVFLLTIRYWILSSAGNRAMRLIPVAVVFGAVGFSLSYCFGTRPSILTYSSSISPDGKYALVNGADEHDRSIVMMNLRNNKRVVFKPERVTSALNVHWFEGDRATYISGGGQLWTTLWVDGSGKPKTTTVYVKAADGNAIMTISPDRKFALLSSKEGAYLADSRSFVVVKVGASRSAWWTAPHMLEWRDKRGGKVQSLDAEVAVRTLKHVGEVIR